MLVPVAALSDVASNAGGERRPNVASPLTDQLVLCVDNEPEILDAMKRLLEKWGARPLAADSVAGALRAVRAARRENGTLPALMLIDYHLDNDETGTDVIDALAEDTGRDIPAIVLTADHSETVIGTVRGRGLRLLHKPIKPAALRAMMTSLLSRRDVA